MQLKLLMSVFIVVWFNFSMKGIYTVSFTKQESISLKTNDDAQCSHEENNI